MRIRNPEITDTIRLYFLGGAFVLLPFILFSQIPFQSGWPVEISEHYASPILIADIDDDGNKEIVLLGLPNNFQPPQLYCFNYDGTLQEGFPIQGPLVLPGNPALFDSNDDGKLEIVQAMYGLHMYGSDGSEIWYLPADGPIFQSTYGAYQVSIDDLDYDGRNEIVVTCRSGGAVFVFEPDGTVRPGWPVIIPPIPGFSPPMIFSSASIGDLDQDGIKELVVGVDDRKVHCYKPDGSSCPGFPVDFGLSGYRSKAVLVDIDNDGYLEIIIGKQDAQLRVLKYDGTLFPGYPIPILVQGIAVGDVDKDGNIDIMFGRSGLLYSYEASTASILPNFPFSDPSGEFYLSAKAPILCDLSDDFGVEIVSGAGNGGFVGDGKLFAYDLSGQVLPDFPSGLLYHRVLGSVCSVNDLDSDGDIEICCGSENMEFTVPRTSTVYCWDIDHPYNLDNVDWAMDGFDLGHTGRWRKLYHIDKVNSTLTVEGCTSSPCMLVPDGSLKEVTVTATRQADGTHPTAQDVRLSRTLGCGEYEGPVIDNGDGTYTRMLRLPDGDECTTDIHAWVNEFKLEEGVRINFFACLEDLGDVNGNGAISAFDASLALMDVVGMISLDDTAVCRADVNQNFTVTSLDAAYILMCVVGNCPSLPTSQFHASCLSHGNCF